MTLAAIYLLGVFGSWIEWMREAHPHGCAEFIFFGVFSIIPALGWPIFAALTVAHLFWSRWVWTLED